MNDSTNANHTWSPGLSEVVAIGAQSAAAAAVAATLTNGVGLVIGAAALPLFNEAVSNLIERRADSFRKKLESSGLSPELLVEKVIARPELVDMVNAAAAAALGTDLVAKRDLLAEVLASAVLSEDSRQAAVSRRLVSALLRIDNAEIRMLDVVSSRTRPTRTDLFGVFGDVDADVLDTVVAVLVSEGLVVGDLDAGLSLSGFGLRLLNELSASPGPEGVNIAQ
jgi:hypothetical protein